MPAKPRTAEQIVTLLAAAPVRIAEVTAGMAPADLRTAPAPAEWSANDVLAHLRACADVWGDCIAVMLAEDSPTIRAINPTTWIDRTDYRELEFAPSLHAFTEQRAALRRVLEPLSADGWSRGGTVTGAGRPLTRTVLSYARWMAEHERPHLKQIQRTVERVRR